MKTPTPERGAEGGGGPGGPAARFRPAGVPTPGVPDKRGDRRVAGLCVVLAVLGLCSGSGAEALDPKRQITQYSVRSWLPRDGLPHGHVFDIAQTPDGYLWIGTAEGLVRFDGARFSVLNTRTKPGFRNNQILDLAVDASGVVWSATGGGGLVRVKDGVVKTYTTDDGLAHDYVRTVCEDARGRIWAGTEGGLSVIVGDRVTTPEAARGLPSDSIWVVLPDESGGIWAGTLGGGLLHVSDQGAEVVISNDRVGGSLVRALYRDRSGALWVAMQRGLVRVVGDDVIRFETPEPFSCRGVTIDRDGNTWFATRSGLYRYRDGEYGRLTVAGGLAATLVTALFEDAEGSLWIGTDRGLSQLRDGWFVTYSAREGLAGDDVFGLLARRNGEVWVASETALDVVSSRGEIESVVSINEPPRTYILSLAETETAVWAGTGGEGLLRVEGRRIAGRVGPGDGLADEFVRVVLPARSGGIWVGTHLGGLARVRGGTVVESYTTSNGLSKNMVLAVAETSDGSVYVGTGGGGVNIIRNGTVRAVTERDGLSDDIVWALRADDATGAVWVGTNRGLDRITGDRVEPLTDVVQLPFDAVHIILGDAQGRLWITSEIGIYSLREADVASALAGLADEVPVHRYGTADGLKSSVCNYGFQPAGVQAPDGRLWFPTTRGAAVVDPLRIRPDTSAPPVRVERLVADGESRVARGPITLPAGIRRLEVHYTGIDFIAPERVRFRYRLLGEDSRWEDAGGRRVAYYTNLPAGSYRFQVAALNRDGYLSESPATVDVTIAPFFWETTWFLAACAVVAVAAAWGAYRWRVGQLIRRRDLLENQVHARTLELAGEKAKLEVALGELEQANEVKTDLLRIAAHDLKNPLQSIMGHAEMIQMAAGEASRAGSRGRRIFDASERMVRLINELLETSAVDSGDIRLELSNVSVADLVSEAVEANRVNAERKEQSLRLEVRARPFVQADRERLEQVVDNLISNAVKYSQLGGRLLVVVDACDRRARVEVHDAGPGLSAEELQRVFRRFQRLSATPTGGETSTGLGLSIAKKLVELHGGTIRAESDGPGAGAVFWFELPTSGPDSPADPNDREQTGQKKDP